MDCSPPLSSVHGIFQARILERVSISYSRRSLPKSRDWIHIYCISSIGRWILYHCTTWKARNYKFYWTSTQRACHIIHHPSKQVIEQQSNVTNKKQFSVVDSNFYTAMNLSYWWQQVWLALTRTGTFPSPLPEFEYEISLNHVQCRSHVSSTQSPIPLLI